MMRVFYVISFNLLTYHIFLSFLGLLLHHIEAEKYGRQHVHVLLLFVLNFRFQGAGLSVCLVHDCQKYVAQNEVEQNVEGKEEYHGHGRVRVLHVLEVLIAQRNFEGA